MYSVPETKLPSHARASITYDYGDHDCGDHDKSDNYPALDVLKIQITNNLQLHSC